MLQDVGCQADCNLARVRQRTEEWTENVETAHFLILPQRHRLDSVTRHRLWQDGLEREPFYDQVFGDKEATTAA
jgi:hypothetical protein